ncbi:MAG: hypothetical protein HC890_07175 [Chloroflexaceae bacterium]|nr:hypothetical protein [Chloroflexaceae bacterium]
MIGLIVVVVALIKIAYWLAIAIILGAAAGMGYLPFLKSGDRQLISLAKNGTISDNFGSFYWLLARGNNL